MNDLPFPLQLFARLFAALALGASLYLNSNNTPPADDDSRPAYEQKKAGEKKPADARKKEQP